MNNDLDNNTVMPETQDAPNIQPTPAATVPQPAPVKSSGRKRSKKRQRKSVLIPILAVIAILSIACNIFLVVRYKIRIQMLDGKPTILSENQYNVIKREAREQVEDEVTAEVKSDVLELVKKRLTAGDSATYLFRVYYPDHIVYMDEGIYKFVPVNSSLKKNVLTQANFKTNDNGEISYSDGNITSVKGIDVSKYQGNIDFAKVKASGVDYVMVRCAYRGYSDGKIVKDTNFDTNATNATANGLDMGVYFFSQATTKDEAVEEANYVLDSIKGYDVTYPIAIDVEDIANADGRQEKLSAKELTDVIIAFCDTIKSAGYTPMIYSNIRYFAGMVEYERLEDYDKWFASYSTQLYFPYEISMWQYTNTGSVDGIKGDVDINISFKKYSR
ncbi:MAG: glycoside hydrolase family 25 protein [Lachnospira sp.]|nr:glycoside hydrolase family 25 protein [Lachnospira sp.]